MCKQGIRHKVTVLWVISFDFPWFWLIRLLRPLFCSPFTFMLFSCLWQEQCLLIWLRFTASLIYFMLQSLNVLWWTCPLWYKKSESMKMSRVSIYGVLSDTASTQCYLCRNIWESYSNAQHKGISFGKIYLNDQYGFA